MYMLRVVGNDVRSARVGFWGVLACLGCPPDTSRPPLRTPYLQTLGGSVLAGNVLAHSQTAITLLRSQPTKTGQDIFEGGFVSHFIVVRDPVAS